MAAENDNQSTSTNKFELDGVEYEVPAFIDLELGDWELVWDECKVALADFAPIDGDEDAESARQTKLKSPYLERSFLMIAYLRANAEATVDEAREKSRRAKLVPLLEALNPDEAEADADPPTSAKKPGSPSNSGSSDSTSSSSTRSPKSSDEPDDALATTGTSG